MSVWFGFFYSIPNQVKPNLVGFFNRFGLVFRFGAILWFGLNTPSNECALIPNMKWKLALGNVFFLIMKQIIVINLQIL